MLPLREGVMLGLWSRKTVEPAADAPAGASEVAFTVENAAAVEATFADWKKRGLNILQEPVQMDFGMTFVATDPDGHRLRVFVPAAA
jgi:predicted enzyme related to lactoylglutathione lyase